MMRSVFQIGTRFQDSLCLYLLNPPSHKQCAFCLLSDKVLQQQHRSKEPFTLQICHQPWLSFFHVFLFLLSTDIPALPSLPPFLSTIFQMSPPTFNSHPAGHQWAETHDCLGVVGNANNMHLQVFSYNTWLFSFAQGKH